MKVLNINIFFKKGSTGKIVYEIHKELIKQGHESFVAYGLEKNDEKGLYKYSSDFFSKFYLYLSALTGLQYMFSFLSTKKLIKIIENTSPDIIHIHVINCNTVNIYRILNFIKSKNYKTILTFHAEYLYTGGCSHAFNCMKWKTGCGNCPHKLVGLHSLFFDFSHYFWKKFEKIYEGWNELRIVCVSDWLKNRAIQSPFFKFTPISVIENGVNTENVFYPRNNGEIVKKYRNTDMKIVLHVTPSFKQKLKGGDFIIQVAEKLIHENYLFIIVGYDDNRNLPKNILPIKVVKDQNILAEYYSVADVTVLTSKVETYSMVTVESLCCGTPVVGFKCGAPETIALKDFSQFVDYGETEQLLEIIKKWSEKKSLITNELHRIAKTHYSSQKMINEYIETYKKHI